MGKRIALQVGTFGVLLLPISVYYYASDGG